MHPAVQKECLVILNTLIEAEEIKLSTFNNTSLGNIINGMMLHINNVEIQKLSFSIVCSLSLLQDNRRRISDVGGTDAVVISMRVHYYAEEVVAKGCKALEMLHDKE